MRHTITKEELNRILEDAYRAARASAFKAAQHRRGFTHARFNEAERQVYVRISVPDPGRRSADGDTDSWDDRRRSFLFAVGEQVLKHHYPEMATRPERDALRLFRNRLVELFLGHLNAVVDHEFGPRRKKEEKDTVSLDDPGHPPDLKRDIIGQIVGDWVHPSEAEPAQQGALAESASVPGVATAEGDWLEWFVRGQKDPVKTLMRRVLADIDRKCRARGTTLVDQLGIQVDTDSGLMRIRHDSLNRFQLKLSECLARLAPRAGGASFDERAFLMLFVTD